MRQGFGAFAQPVPDNSLFTDGLDVAKLRLVGVFRAE